MKCIVPKDELLEAATDMKDNYRKQAANGKKWCYDCRHYYKMGGFGGYSACQCHIYGSLDCDQRKYHPDTTADTCKDYEANGRAPWYE